MHSNANAGILHTIEHPIFFISTPKEKPVLTEPQPSDPNGWITEGHPLHEGAGY